MGTIYPGAPGATGQPARARSLAEHATPNTTEEANDRCRTPDGSAAEEKHSGHTRTNLVPRQPPSTTPNYPHRAPFKQLRNNLVGKLTPGGHRTRRTRREIPLPPPKGGLTKLVPLIEWATTKPA